MPVCDVLRQSQPTEGRQQPLDALLEAACIPWISCASHPSNADQTAMKGSLVLLHGTA